MPPAPIRPRRRSLTLYLIGGLATVLALWFAFVNFRGTHSGQNSEASGAQLHMSPFQPEGESDSSQPDTNGALGDSAAAVSLSAQRWSADDVRQHCGRPFWAAARRRCASFGPLAANVMNTFPPTGQDVVRCWGGSMTRPLDEAAVKEEWRKRIDRINEAAGSGGGGGQQPNAARSDTDVPFDDAFSLSLAARHLLEGSTGGGSSSSLVSSSPFSLVINGGSVDPDSSLPRGPNFLLKVLHGGISPSVMAAQARYMRRLIGLEERFSALEVGARIATKTLMELLAKGSSGKKGDGESADFASYKRSLFQRLVADGRLVVPRAAEERLRAAAANLSAAEASPLACTTAIIEALSQEEWAGGADVGNSDGPHSGVFVRPDTVLAELGAGAATVLYSMCPADPFDLSTVCLGADVVRVLLADAVANAPHMRFSEGYGFASMPAGASLTHVMSHGVATVICERCLCGHVAEMLRLLRPGGTMLLWMIRTRHHENNMDPSYYNATFLGEGVGVVGSAEAEASTDAASAGVAFSAPYKGRVPSDRDGYVADEGFFFMDKCRYEHGVHLSPFVDRASVELPLETPTPLYAACWRRDGFFGLRLRRSFTPWGAMRHADAANAGARPPMTPAEFVGLSSGSDGHAKRMAALKGKDGAALSERLSVRTDLCPLLPSYEKRGAAGLDDFANLVAEAQRHSLPTTHYIISVTEPIDNAIPPPTPKSTGGAARSAVAFKFLSPALQAWVADLILEGIVRPSSAAASHSSSSSASDLIVSAGGGLRPEWAAAALVTEMMHQRSARIRNATLHAAKCGRGGRGRTRKRWWCADGSAHKHNERELTCN